MKSVQKLGKTTSLFISQFYHLLLHPFWINIFYFFSLSFLGFGVLKSLNPRSDVKPGNIDLIFTSVSAATVSSMSTVEMEVFSDSQLIIITLLMLVGGEIFTSMVGLHFNSYIMSSKIKSRDRIKNPEVPEDQPFDSRSILRYVSVRFLSFVVVGYFLAVQIVGVAALVFYLALYSSAENVLRKKGIRTSTFAIFTIVSTFANCGFVPTNENMIVFRRNPGMLLILLVQILLGNTLFPPALRAVIRFLGKRLNYDVEASYLLDNTKEAGYPHLLPRLQSLFLTATVFVLLLVGFVLFFSIDWNLAGLDGMSTYQKVVGIIFECSNARYSGETIVDLSTVAPSILVFFIFLMYIPPYTLFLPVNKEKEEIPAKIDEDRRLKLADKLVFSQLGFLVIFIIVICITERKSLQQDPLNFSLLNIVVEVISAYGNVGFTMGYSCERQLKTDPNCVNKFYGFSGKWSNEGKIVLILVMFFGRLKKFSTNGGRAWKLL